MADVTIKYKGSTIAEMSGTDAKTLKTAGTYCEGDITVDYAPRCKTYEITLSKSSGWVLLTALDDEVLAHINDTDLTVSLKKIGDYEYINYSGNCYICGNVPCGYSGSYAVYGSGNRMNTETSISTTHLFYPANKTDTSTSIGGAGVFRLNGKNYYIRPGDGYVCPGTWKLIFTW